MKKKIPVFQFAHDQRGVLNGSVCSYPLQTWGWRGWGRDAGGLPFLAEQPVSVLWPDGRSSLRRVHRSCIFYTGAGGESLLNCICVSACVCEEEPGVSAFSKRNEHSELYVVRHNFASTLVCPVTCHYVKFPLVFPSLSEHEHGCHWRWSEPLENLLWMAGARVRSGLTLSMYFSVQYLEENTENHWNRISCKPSWPFYLIWNTMN